MNLNLLMQNKTAVNMLFPLPNQFSKFYDTITISLQDSNLCFPTNNSKNKV